MDKTGKGKVKRSIRKIKFDFTYCYIFIFLFTALFASFIANDRPLLSVCSGKISFPFLQGNHPAVNHLHADNCLIVYAPIPYSPEISDPLNADFIGPFDAQRSIDQQNQVTEMPLRTRHWLGTNMRGNDLASEMIYGTRISLLVSLMSTLFSFLIGGILGFTAGWYGPGKYRIPFYWLLSGFVLIFFLWFFNKNLIVQYDRIIGNVIVVVFFFVLFLVSRRIQKTAFYNLAFFFNPDGIIQWFSQVFTFIPRIVFILSLVPVMKPSFFSVIFILAVSGWVDISRLLRSEIQRLKNEGFIEAARMSGAEGFRVFTRHMVPNLWPSMLVIFLYTFAGNIAAEASLSFLGFGLPVEIVTLGSLVASGKVYFDAWWLVVFPGLWISGFVFSLFSVSRKLRKSRNVSTV